MHHRIRTGLSAFFALLFISTASMAGGLSSYSQDFESLDIMGTEIGDGWTYFVNVFENGAYEFGYGGAAPNGPQMSAIAAGEGDIPQGAQQLSVYSDYDCCPGDFGHQSANGLVETNIYQEQTIAGSNVGETWSFNFDAKLGNLDGSATALAFIKVLDPLDSFSQTAIASVDMTTIPTTWGSYQLDLPIGSWDGQILQFGFQTNAYIDSSGVVYDNVTFGGGVGPGIEPFSDDFESYDDQDIDVLGNAGYLVFGNVTTLSGSFLYGYGPDPAPNQSGAFSGVSVGEGGPAQGDQQLNTFNDYNNVAEHEAGNLVEAIVYREQPINAGNVGETWTFSFEAKLGNLVPPTTAKAFIKTIDPDNGFSTTNDVFVATTSTPTTWTGYQLELFIDAGLVGQLFQIGFSNTATSFNPSGVFYDNVNLVRVVIDSDEDGVPDSTDNCTDVANASQLDTDGDLIGNACDADVDGSGPCFVNFLDANIYRDAFFGNGSVPTPNWNPDTDNNGDNFTNFLDLQVLSAQFFGQPGPSAAGCN